MKIMGDGGGCQNANLQLEPPARIATAAQMNALLTAADNAVCLSLKNRLLPETAGGFIIQHGSKEHLETMTKLELLVEAVVAATGAEPPSVQSSNHDLILWVTRSIVSYGDSRAQDALTDAKNGLVSRKPRELEIVSNAIALLIFESIFR